MDHCRYIPPHKRSSPNIRSKRKRKFPEPNHNCKPISSDEKNFNIPGNVNDIQVPEIIAPPVIELTPQGSVCSRPVDGLYPSDIKLLDNIARIRREYMQKSAQDDFDEWINHYDTDLREMFDRCIANEYGASETNRPGILGITYNKFIQLAYQCTDTTYDRKKFKYTRPLI